MNRKIKLLAAVLALTGSTSYAQLAQQWTNVLGSTGNDGVQAIGSDNSNNVYTAGYFSSSIDADPGTGTATLTSSGLYDIVISKFDASGNLLWAKRIGGTGNDVAFAMAVDASGNQYITGYFAGTVDFDPNAGTSNLVASGATETFILKLSPTGNLVWAKQFNGSIQGYDVELDGYGQMYLCGIFGGTCDFNPSVSTNNLTTLSNRSGYIVRLDTDGNYQWARHIYSSGTPISNAYELTLDGGINPDIYITGGFTGTNDFDVGAGTLSLNSNGGSDIFVLKMNFGGSTLWAKSFGSSTINLEERGFGITTDGNGNVFITGQFAGTVDFDPNAGTYDLSSNGDYDAFVQKLDGTGNFVNAVSFGSTGLDIGVDIETDASNGLYIVGSYAGTMDADPGSGTINLPNAGSDDIFIQKLSNTLTYEWALNVGGTGQEYLGDIYVNPSFVYVSGYFFNTLDINFGSATTSVSSNANSRDQFFGKYSTCTLPGNIASISGPANLCVGSTTGFTSASSFWATSYNWTLPAGFSGNSSTSNINATAGSNGGTITVQGVNNCGNGIPTSISIAVQSIPATPSITGIGLTCEGGNYLYSTPVDLNASTYSWLLPSGWSGTSNTNTISATAGNTSGNIQVSAGNSCGNSAFAYFGVQGNTVPSSPSFSSSVSAMCSNESALFEVTPLGNATSYDWSYTGDFSGASTGADITLYSGILSGDLSVEATNYCGSSQPTILSVTVNVVPTINSSDISICEGSPAELEAGSDYGTISWFTNSSGGTAEGNGPTFITSPLYNDTTFFVEADNAGCISSPRLPVNVTVMPMPQTGVSLSNGTLSALQNNATSYEWLDCNSLFSQVGSTSQDYTPTQNGSYAVLVNLNGCVDTSACEIIDNVGISDLFVEEINIYPNPSTEKVCVELSSGMTELLIFNMAGKELVNMKLDGQKTIQLCPEFETGTYLLQIKDSYGNTHLNQWIKL